MMRSNCATGQLAPKIRYSHSKRLPVASWPRTKARRPIAKRRAECEGRRGFAWRHAPATRPAGFTAPCQRKLKPFGAELKQGVVLGVRAARSVLGDKAPSCSSLCE